MRSIPLARTAPTLAIAVAARRVRLRDAARRRRRRRQNDRNRRDRRGRRKRRDEGAAAPAAAPAASAPGAARPPGARGQPPPAAAAAAAAAAAQSQKPFADVIKDAKETPGLFRVFQKDEKVWIELAPDQFDTPFFFSWNLSRGLGERFIYGGLMGDSEIVEFHRVGNTVQLLAKNQIYFASQGKPQARAVAEAFSDSLIAAVPVASQPHPERKSVLIEVNALLACRHPRRQRRARARVSAAL